MNLTKKILLCTGATATIVSGIALFKKYQFNNLSPEEREILELKKEIRQIELENKVLKAPMNMLIKKSKNNGETEG